jgi:hypothetical protein
MQASYTYRPSAFWKAKCSHSISWGWVDSFILRYRNDLTETKSTLQEDLRLEVPRAFLNETIWYAACETTSKKENKKGF